MSVSELSDFSKPFRVSYTCFPDPDTDPTEEGFAEIARKVAEEQRKMRFRENVRTPSPSISASSLPSVSSLPSLASSSASVSEEETSEYSKSSSRETSGNLPKVSQEASIIDKIFEALRDVFATPQGGITNPVGLARMIR